MLQTRNQDRGASPGRRTGGRRPTMLDALLMPPLADLSFARGLMNALTPAITEAAQFVPNIEVSEQDGKYIIDAALPGFTPDNIEVEVSGNEVTISGTYERTREDRRTHYTEMQQASFVRSVVLPKEIDESQVTANFDNGILHITLPPKEPIAAQKVSIGSSSQSSSGQSSAVPTVSGQTNGGQAAGGQTSGAQTSGAQTSGAQTSSAQPAGAQT